MYHLSETKLPASDFLIALSSYKKNISFLNKDYSFISPKIHNSKTQELPLELTMASKIYEQGNMTIQGQKTWDYNDMLN